MGGEWYGWVTRGALRGEELCEPKLEVGGVELRPPATTTSISDSDR